MSGLELVVRPVVLRDTRPTPQPVRPASDPDENLAIIAGSGGGLIDLAESYNNSWSKNRAHEVKRVYDEVRVYNEDDPDMYIDYEAVKKLHVRDSKGRDEKYMYAKIKEKFHRLEILTPDQEKFMEYDSDPQYEDEKWAEYYPHEIPKP